MTKDPSCMLCGALSVYLNMLLYLAAMISIFGHAMGNSSDTAPFLVVLGVAQDGGVPHAGCEKECCRDAWKDPLQRRRVSCLGVVDPVAATYWLIEATPDLPDQLRALSEIVPGAADSALAGILLTHGHIGHYTGLMHLGREVMGAREVPVYAMPRMRQFLSSASPWDQLIRLRNISLQPLSDGVAVQLNERISIRPFLVPHRDEYTETVGFQITGPRRTAIFIPDIDKWEKWTTRIEEMISEVDRAYLDGTFYADGEVPGRAMWEIPHPFIVETMRHLSTATVEEKAKVRFIHLNHSNPALRARSETALQIVKSGFRIAQEGERFEL